MITECCSRGSLVQFKVAPRSSEKNPYTLHPVSQTFHRRCPWNSFNVGRIDDGPCFQGRSSSASLLPAIDDVMSLPLCLGAVSPCSSSTFRILRDASRLWWLLSPPGYVLSHFPSLQHVQYCTSARISEGGCRLLTRASLGFKFLCPLFVTSHLLRPLKKKIVRMCGMCCLRPFSRWVCCSL